MKKAVFSAKYILILFPLFFAGCASIPVDKTSSAIEPAELQTHVEFLAQPALKGRKASSWESATVRKYIKGRFADYGLKPWADTKDYALPFRFGTNIIGLLPGSDPALAGEIIILSAHYDHIGGDLFKYFPGASDNAAGVAALLEIAEKLSLAEQKPKRTICFAAFDAEEKYCLGAFAFTCRDDYDDSKITAAVNIDLLGRDFLDVVADSLLMVGSQNYPAVYEQVVRSGQKIGLKILTVDSKLCGPVGDHVAFTSEKRPSLFFSCGIYKDYHKTTDTPEKINYTQTNKQAHVIHDCVLALANADTIQKQYRPDEPDTSSAESLAYIMSQIELKPQALALDPNQLVQLKSARQKMESIIDQRPERQESVRLQRETLTELMDLLEKNNKELAGYGKSFIEMSWLYSEQPEFLTEALKDLVRQFLTKKPSLFGKTKYEYKSETIYTWGLSEPKSGQCILAVEQKDFTLQVVFLSGLWPTWTSVYSRGYSTCKGTKQEILDYCLLNAHHLSWEGHCENAVVLDKLPSHQGPDLDKLIKQSGKFIKDLKETNKAKLNNWLEIINKLWPDSCRLDLKQLLDRHFEQRNYKDKDEWLMLMMQHENPEIAKAAISNAVHNLGDKAARHCLKMIRNEQLRPDVRSTAVFAVHRNFGKPGLLALADIVNDNTQSRNKEYDLLLDKDFPLDNKIFGKDMSLKRRESLEKWYDNPKNQKTLGDTALEKLKSLTEQDFGKDKQAWIEWINTNVESDEP